MDGFEVQLVSSHVCSGFLSKSWLCQEVMAVAAEAVSLNLILCLTLLGLFTSAGRNRFPLVIFWQNRL